MYDHKMIKIFYMQILIYKKMHMNDSNTTTSTITASDSNDGNLITGSSNAAATVQTAATFAHFQVGYIIKYL